MFFFGLPTITQKGTIIKIEGIKTRSFLRDISKVWNTQRISNNIFESYGYNYIRFEAFFALELFIIIDKIIHDRTIYSNVRLLKSVLNGLKNETWLKNINAPIKSFLNYKALEDLLIKPLPHQMDFFELYEKQTQRYMLKGFLLGTLPGSGKTITGLTLMQLLNAERIIIICPKTAIERVWETTVSSIYKEPQTWWSTLKNKQYDGERFAIFHYEALNKALGLIPLLKTTNTGIILDESHNLNELNAQRTNLFLDLCKQVNSKNTILASGTPIKATPLETVPLFSAIDPLFTPNVVDKFKKIYRGSTNDATEILTHRLNEVKFTIPKETLKLEPPIFRTLSIKIPDSDIYTLDEIAKDIRVFALKQIKLYTSMEKETEKKFLTYLEKARLCFLSPLLSKSELKNNEIDFTQYKLDLNKVLKGYKEGRLRDYSEEIIRCNKFEKNKILPCLETSYEKNEFKEVKTLYKYLRLKVQGECLGRILGRKRVEAHVAMIPFINFEGILNSTLKKTVIFTSYTEVVEGICSHLKTVSLNPIAVYGETNKNLSPMLIDFEKNPKTNPLVATYQSLSTAVPLIMADTVVIINAPYRNYVLEQAISRVHRLGSTTQTVVYTCILDTEDKPNISSRTSDILKWSQDQVEKILGVEPIFKLDNNDVYTALESLNNLDVRQVTKELNIAIEKLEIDIKIPTFNTLSREVFVENEKKEIWQEWYYDCI